MRISSMRRYLFGHRRLVNIIVISNNALSAFGMYHIHISSENNIMATRENVQRTWAA